MALLEKTYFQCCIQHVDGSNNLVARYAATISKGANWGLTIDNKMLKNEGNMFWSENAGSIFCKTVCVSTSKHSI